MSTKTKEAAVKHLDALVFQAARKAEEGNRYWINRMMGQCIIEDIDDIEKMICEYELEHSLLIDSIKKIYEELMKAAQYREAAHLAKRFNL